MMKLALATLVFAVAVPASAQNPAIAPPAAAPAAKPDPLDKVVCRTEESIGSRLGGHRVCATVRKWQEQQAEHREAFERVLQQGQTNVKSN